MEPTTLIFMIISCMLFIICLGFLYKHHSELKLIIAVLELHNKQFNEPHRTTPGPQPQRSGVGPGTHLMNGFQNLVGGNDPLPILTNADRRNPHINSDGNLIPANLTKQEQDILNMFYGN